ncbi:MAG: hypothetical protein UR93_C0013G0003 [Berkelbacteria bacterium GW2011_GWA2_35_9]|uniref:DUF4143 domain-containing protein n=1 Tax=Berkelbacteria bacterium GW2011_GWA2_35_9 TaxID=1618333 RepID=A0A0G0D532_9BACT|nr:MAG: hypothetical protein UR93_C0013G0003 [Berkelbacteria bacterium GW2011_GWA2_35_9]
MSRSILHGSIVARSGRSDSTSPAPGGEVDLVVKNSEGTIAAYEIKWGAKKITTPRLFKEQYNIQVKLIDRSHLLFI